MNAAHVARAHGAAALCGAVLLFAGALKAGDPADFGRLILGYQLLPAALVPAVAVIVPWLEVATGALLIANRFRLGAAVIASALSVGFLVAGVSVVARGIETACGCFGGWSGNVGAMSLGIEVVLALAAGLALRGAWRAAYFSPGTTTA